MILKHIVEFAEKNVTGIPTGYQPRFITKVIQLRGDGSLRSVIMPTAEKRGKRSGQVRNEPQESPMRTVAVQPRLLADNVNYVLGKIRDKDKPEKVAERHNAWASQLQEAADALNLPQLNAVRRWLDSGGPVALQNDERFAEDDDITFEVDGVFPTALPEVQTYWANRAESEFTGQCLITGVTGPVTDRMPSMIKGVPNGQMSGTALVSVNNAAGESYGNSAALNSPISPDSAEKLCNGLNYLINEGNTVQDDKGRERTKYKYSLRVGPTVYIAWCQNGQEENFWDNFDQPDPAHVQQLINQVKSGGDAPKVLDTDFYVMSLSANAARIIVRDFHETTLATVRANIGRWYQRLSLIGTDGQPAKPVGIYRLAASLYRDANKEMPAHVPADLINSALTGRPLPEYLLGLAVKRNLAMQGPYTFNKAKKKATSTPRIALIKAILTKNAEDTSLSQLNKDHPHPAYHCGRLLAVLESIQKVAIPGLNTTLTDRHYGAASASPASVFSNLLKNATSAHLPKLRKDPSRKGLFHFFDQRLQEILAAIGDEFPKTLVLQDQGLFALGFYHQKAIVKKNPELSALDESESLEENPE